MKNCLILLLLAIAAPALADAPLTIPEEEDAFVRVIQKQTQAQIAEALGDPAFRYDIHAKTGEVLGSIWHYHFVTMADDGQYYKTTELDFVGDRVATVVLINEEDEPTAAVAPCDQAATSGTC